MVEKLLYQCIKLDYYDFFYYLPIFEILRVSTGKLFDNALYLFTNILNNAFSSFEPNNSENEKNNYLLWSIVESLKDCKEKDTVEYSKINSFVEYFLQKYPILKKYPEKIHLYWKRFKRIEGFDYSKLDIRKK